MALIPASLTPALLSRHALQLVRLDVLPDGRVLYIGSDVRKRKGDAHPFDVGWVSLSGINFLSARYDAPIPHPLSLEAFAAVDPTPTLAAIPIVDADKCADVIRRCLLWKWQFKPALYPTYSTTRSVAYDETSPQEAFMLPKSPTHEGEATGKATAVPVPPKAGSLPSIVSPPSVTAHSMGSVYSPMMAGRRTEPPHIPSPAHTAYAGNSGIPTGNSGRYPHMPAQSPHASARPRPPHIQTTVTLPYDIARTASADSQDSLSAEYLPVGVAAAGVSPIVSGETVIPPHYSYAGSGDGVPLRRHVSEQSPSTHGLMRRSHFDDAAAFPLQSASYGGRAYAASYALPVSSKLSPVRGGYTGGEYGAARLPPYQPYPHQQHARRGSVSSTTSSYSAASSSDPYGASVLVPSHDSPVVIPRHISPHVSPSHGYRAVGAGSPPLGPHHSAFHTAAPPPVPSYQPQHYQQAHGHGYSHPHPDLMYADSPYGGHATRVRSQSNTSAGSLSSGYSSVSNMPLSFQPPASTSPSSAGVGSSSEHSSSSGIWGPLGLPGAVRLGLPTPMNPQFVSPTANKSLIAVGEGVSFLKPDEDAAIPRDSSSITVPRVPSGDDSTRLIVDYHHQQRHPPDNVIRRMGTSYGGPGVNPSLSSALPGVVVGSSADDDDDDGDAGIDLYDDLDSKSVGALSEGSVLEHGQSVAFANPAFSLLAMASPVDILRGTDTAAATSMPSWLRSSASVSSGDSTSVATAAQAPHSYVA